MFGFGKQKISAVQLGESFGEVMSKILSASANEGIEIQLAEMIAAGADAQRIRPELAVFSAFQCWAGIAGALQQKKITENQFDILMSAFWRRLHETSIGVNVDSIGSVSYSTTSEWAKARIDRYIAILTEVDAQRVNAALVENFCDFTCDDQPNPVLSLKVLESYLAGTAGTFELLAASRLV